MENINEDLMDFDGDHLEMEAVGHDDEIEDNEVVQDFAEQYRKFDEGIGGSMTSIDCMEVENDLPNILKRRHEDHDDPCDLELKKLKLEEKN